MPAAPGPPCTGPAQPTAPPFCCGPYRRLCGGIVNPRSINAGLWTSLAVEVWWRYGLRCSPPPPQMATTPYISRISPRPLPTSMRQNITRQGHQCKPMDFTRSQDLVELWPNMWLLRSGSARVGEEVVEVAEQQSTRCRGAPPNSGDNWICARRRCEDCRPCTGQKQFTSSGIPPQKRTLRFYAMVICRRSC
jgi:hypothetical protein